MFRFLLVFLLSLALFATYSYNLPPKKAEVDPTRKFESEYFVVVIMDGPRYTETFGDSTYAHIPHLGKELVKEGVLLPDFRNNGPTYTNAGHTAITTGFYQSISNAGKELPKNPSMFQYFIKAKNADKTDAYVVASKGKLEILGNTKDKKWWNMYMPSTYCGPNGNSSEYGPDVPTLNKVLDLFKTKPPKLMIVNFLAADTYAHSKDWEAYLLSIKNIDGYINTMWQAIQSNEKMRNKTTLIMTNDHGRHLDGHKQGFAEHGDGCEGCRHIALLAMGPDFKKGVRIEKYGEQIDISKTIAYMMGFEMPTSNGKVMTELFK